MDTPDLQGAGLGSQEQDTPSLINTLRSQGSMPSAALQMLMQQPQGGGLMEALAGGVSMMQGRPNPVTAQRMAQSQQQTQMLKAVDTIQTHQALQQYRQDVLAQRNAKMKWDQAQADKKDERANATSAMNVMLKMYESESTPPEWKAANAPRIQAMVKAATGWDVPPPPVMQKVDSKERNEFYAWAVIPEVTDAQIKNRFPWATDAVIRSARTMPDTPELRALVGAPSKMEQDKKAADLVQSQVKGWAEVHGFKLDSPEYGYASQFYRDKTGKALYQANDSDPNDLSLMAQARAYAEAKGEAKELKKQRDKREDEIFRDKLIQDRQLAAEGRQPVSHNLYADLRTMSVIGTPTKKEWQDNRQFLRPLTPDQVNTLGYISATRPQFDQLRALIPQLLKDHSPDNIVNGLKGSAAKALRNDPRWTQFDQLTRDTTAEMTRAMGGSSQFRTYLLQYFEKANLTTRDTQEVANIVLDTMDTAVQNRKIGIITGGESLPGSGGASPFKAYPQPNVPGAPKASSPLNRVIKIQMKDGTKRWWELKPGDPIPEGAKEIK